MVVHLESAALCSTVVVVGEQERAFYSDSYCTHRDNCIQETGLCIPADSPGSERDCCCRGCLGGSDHSTALAMSVEMLFAARPFLETSRNHPKLASWLLFVDSELEQLVFVLEEDQIF